MVKTLRQMLVLTLCALQALRDRRGPAIVTVVSVTTVVGVLVSLLAIREGTAIFGAQSAPPDQLVIMGRGARSPFMSVLTREAVQVVADAPGVKKTPDGQPFMYSSVMAPVDVIRKQDAKRGTVFVVGYTPGSKLVESSLQLLEGRWYEPGRHEVVVPDAARKMYQGLDIGSRIDLRGVQWSVVGVAAARNSIGDSFLRADADSVMSAFGLNNFQQITLRVDSPASIGVFKDAVLSKPQLAVDVKTQASVNEENFGPMNRLLYFMAYSVGGVMACGAIFGALNALYASIDSRRRELATLRAIGFSGSAIILSVIAESVIIALPGAVLGSVLAWALFNGNVVTTGARIFHLTVTEHLVIVGVLWTLAIGLIGGLLPAFRAVRLPIATALRAS